MSIAKTMYESGQVKKMYLEGDRRRIEENYPQLAMDLKIGAGLLEATYFGVITEEERLDINSRVHAAIWHKAR